MKPHPRKRNVDHGKCRTYLCPCGVVCFRPLFAKLVHPCRNCGFVIVRMAYLVDDATVVARNGDYIGRSVG